MVCVGCGNHQIDLVEVGEEGVEGELWSQIRDFAREDELTGTVSVFEESQEFSPEESREQLDVDEEGISGSDPLVFIRR